MSSPKRRLALLTAAAITLTLAARAELPAWLQHIVGASTAEAALYRLMPLPAAQVLYPRPPKESEAELARLITATPADPALYALRARADESALDFTAAETDWKLYVAKAADPAAARIELADYYQRRLETAPELQALREVAAAPVPRSDAAARFTNPSTQRSWRAFERILALIKQQGLPPSETQAAYAAFIARYPDQPAVYARAFNFLLDQKDYAAAQALIPRFHAAFPQDAAFPVRAQALIEYRRGDSSAALATYDRAFQPLWPADLVASYFTLLTQTHQQRAFVAQAQAALAQHPDGPPALNALARIFYYQQQQGHLEAAQQALDSFRIAREQRNGAWSALDLYTLATLSASIHSYAEAARYNYALAATEGQLPDGQPAAQAGLAGLVDTLLSAPDQPIALGAGNLTLYRDIATLDQGPGYWNGVLSLWLNGTSPQTEYTAETAKAQSYFHRAKAAELLTQLDRKYPAAAPRAALHLQLIRVYADYGEAAAVIAAGKQFLTGFPTAAGRIDVANLMADAYAREKDTSAELALYDTTLTSLQSALAKSTGGMPLSAAPPPAPEKPVAEASAENPSQPETPHFDLGAYTPYLPINPDAAAYAALLDRYLARLAVLNQLPRALTVLRHQLDLNPDDPALYERLAAFLEQNNLSGQQEQTYKAAIAHFPATTGAAGFYDRLARLYLRQRNSDAYAALTRQVTDIFSGTELDAWFRNAATFPATLKQLNPQGNTALGPRLALQLNLYAEKRFPHDLVFTRNLASAYTTKPTADAAAYEALLRRHWWQDDQLRSQFFELLSSHSQLQAELAQLQPLATPANPAATRELAEAEIWSSHFEQAAPLLAATADHYPADPDTGDRAVSLYRSLSYLDPTPASLEQAVAIETRLSQAQPADTERLATLGDLYAEATATGGEDLARAAPYWRRIPAIHPGTPEGYLEAATIFWDYFQFSDALAELDHARQQFHNPALYGYEAGAIAENRRDLPAAVREYVTAAGTYPDARARLVELASRPASKQLVDAASLALLAQHPTDPDTITLRADVLTAQRREAEIPALLDAALGKARTPAEAAAIATLAQQRSLTPVYQAALARQAALTADPVEKIQLSYTLAASLEAGKKLPEATRIIADTYRTNPRILGVVRATTDFYARTDQPKAAIATLLEAAHAATPPLARSFTLEAAQKANDANDTAQARQLALTLLPATPYDAQVLGILAASYARAHDDAGLKTFYEAQLAAVRTAQLTPVERKQDTALLRRGLIPALTRLKDYEGALSQYIALLSAYPEDSATAQEAALYALHYDRKPQLVGFLRSTVQQSPSDSRFAILLAQVDTTFEDLPGALAAYDSAIRIRKDRADLYQARVNIELLLGLKDPAQLEAAAADFNRLYLLTYKDPAWMVRLAELRARQQRPADAVKALEAAYITGRPASATNSFRVAAQLADWNLLAEARSFAQQGVTLAGNDLLTPKDSGSGAAIYASILTRLGQPEDALNTLAAARRSVDTATTYPADLAAQLEAQGVDAKDLASQRGAYLKQRRATADTQLNQAVNAMGAAVQTYFTPEQKATFSQVLERLHAAPATASLALSAAGAAGLAEREAAWRAELLLHAPLNQAAAQRAPFATLQQSRLQFAELARTLEGYAARLRTPKARDAALQQAAQAWRASGEEASELRLARTFATRDDTASRDRFFDLLLRHDPAALATFAASSNESLADAAATFAVAHASQATALAAVAARGRGLQPVWQPATAALVRTYFASSKTPAEPAPFLQALAPEATVADRLATAADPARQLTGELWFYYGSRFGIYLATAHPASPADPEDFLPAELEADPTAAAGYLHLAQTYVEANNLPAAIAEFSHALELNPSDLLAHDSFALALYPTQPDQALAHWRTALDLLHRMQQRNTYPETFFSRFTAILAHLGERHLAAQLRPEIDAILRPDLERNGSYRSNELLQAAYTAAATPAQGLAQLLSVTASAPAALQILGDLNRVRWLDPAAHEQILLREIELARGQPADAQNTLPRSLADYQYDLLTLYLDRNQLPQAQALLDSIPPGPDDTFAATRIVLAARSSRLEPMLQGWRDTPESAPAQTSIDTALRQLERATPSYTPSPALIRPLIEFDFDQKQLANTLLPTDFLALAQSRIATGDLPGALQLLNRLALTLPQNPFDSSAPANPYANIDSAAALLETTHHLPEAVPFLNTLTASQPWNATYRLRLAQAYARAPAGGNRAQAIELLTKILRDSSAPYATRVAAAQDLASLNPAGATQTGATQTGSAELALLLAPTPAPAAARQPFFLYARVSAAQTASVPAAERIALLREAIAIDPGARVAQQALLQLLQQEASAGTPSTLIALYEHLQQSPQTSSPQDSSPDDANYDTDAAGSSATGSSAAALPAITASLDVPQRIRLATALAQAYRKLGQPETALPLLQLALDLTPTPDPALLRQRDALQAAIALDRENAARRPQIHKDLAQPNQVRPRLAALPTQEAP